jgi:hypothetical protein
MSLLFFYYLYFAVFLKISLFPPRSILNNYTGIRNTNIIEKGKRSRKEKTFGSPLKRL